MPRLFFRDPVTRAMIPLTLGGSSGGNEVTISQIQPTDGSELWLDMTENVLKYLYPIYGTYVLVPGMSAGGGGTDGIIGAGAGLTGGGYQSTNPNLAVGAGSGISVGADSVAVDKGTLDSWYAPANGHVAVQIDNWDNAVLNNTAYMGADAANAPGPGWYFGTTVSHNSIWKHQVLWAFANSNSTSNQSFEREMDNGAWGDWNRTNNQIFGNGTIDIGIVAQLNGTRADQGVRRTFFGLYKDKNTAAASNSDQFRVQYYNTAGVYAGTAIQIPMGTGVVAHPAGHTLLMNSLRTRAPISEDTAATVGVVVEIVNAMLASAGITINARQVQDAVVLKSAEEVPE